MTKVVANSMQVSHVHNHHEAIIQFEMIKYGK